MIESRDDAGRERWAKYAGNFKKVGICDESTYFDT